MEKFMTIHADSRPEVGKKFAKKVRNEGKVPAIIYGEHKETFPISIALSDMKAIMKSDKGENTLLKIQREDVEVWAMLQDIQYDYSGDYIIHLDLLRIDLEKDVTVNIPVRITGEPVGVKVEGGFLDFMTREIRIKCPATHIPKEFVIDVAELHTGNSIKTADLELEEDIKLISDPHSVICAVMTRGSIEEEEEEAEEGEEGEVAEAEEATTEKSEA